MPTPEWWLTHLTRRLDFERPRLARLRRYLDGDPPLPEGAQGCRKAYQDFQRKARTNLAELITGAVANRMVASHFRVGESNDDDDEARQIWKGNHLGVWSSDVHLDMLGLSAAYVCVQPDENSDIPDVTYQRPEQTIVEHDPRRPDKRRAGLMAYRDDVQGEDVAYLHVPGHVYRWKREIPVVDGIRRPMLTVSGGWVPDVSYESGLSKVPIVPFVNRGGRGEFETHTDLLDRINWVILQRLIITAMQAFRQRATKGDLPETDEAGRPIDYNEMFKPGPGALWQLPEGVDLWESAQTDITGILASVKDDLRDLAAVTTTPLSTLLPDGANQTAEGASYAKEGQIFKAGDRINRARVSWAETMELALALKRGTRDGPEVDVMFLPPERQSLAERADALSKIGDDVSWRYRMTDILGIDGDRVDRMKAERAEDLLEQMTLGAGQPDDVAS